MCDWHTKITKMMQFTLLMFGNCEAQCCISVFLCIKSNYPFVILTP